MVGGSSNVGTAATHGQTHKGPDEHAEEMSLPNAKAALDRIVIPDDTVDRIQKWFRRNPRSSFRMKDQAQKQAEERNL